MMPFDPKTWTHEEIERHSLDMRQFIDFRQSTLPNGMRIIDAYNSSGLTFTLLPDRGLDIWTAHYKGIPLTWISPGSPHPPDFGRGWLEQFNGGLLTTCGLTHVGPAEIDDMTGERRDLHGKYSRLRAEGIRTGKLSHESPWTQLTLWGVIYESELFGTQIRMERTYTLRLGEPGFEVIDRVKNIGDQPVPLMLLYHFNFGYPLIAEGARLFTAYQNVFPRDTAAKAGFETWNSYDAATTGYPEQVFFHHVRHDSHHNSRAMLVRDDIAVVLGWDTWKLPYLTQWKNTRNGIYVCGIEPGNCIPEGQNAARRNGRLQMLEPGEMRVIHVDLDVVEGTEAIESQKREIEDLRNNGVFVHFCNLPDYGM
jgi:hypothetical protein